MPLAPTVALLLALTTPQAPETAPAPPPLALEAVGIEPEAPGPASLCRLKVKVANRGTQPATALAFTVEVNGQELPVYKTAMFVKELPPGATTEVPLYNFWVSETGRPAPTDGKLVVKVTLREARWVTIGQEGDTSVWKLGDAVPGLPLVLRREIALKKP